MFNRNVQKLSLIGVNCAQHKTCNIASLFAIITCNYMRTSLAQPTKMDLNSDTNNRNSATEAGPPLSHHNNGHPSSAGCSGLSNVRRDANWRRESREESNILNTNICATFAASLNAYRHPPNIYYSNNYNVSFNSSPGTSETQNYREIAKRKWNMNCRRKGAKFEFVFFPDQQQILNKYRKWVDVSGESTADGTHFTVLNYNVLAQDLVQENAYLYKNHSARACLWETRWNNLYREITSFNADVTL